MKLTNNPKEIKETLPMWPSRKGDLAEYYAITWLWDNGYEVFQNAGCDGPVDIIAMDSEGNIILIDVKMAKPQPTSRNPDGVAQQGVLRTPIQKKLGVRFLLFNPTNRKLRFVNHESPNQFTNNEEGEIKNERTINAS